MLTLLAAVCAPTHLVQTRPRFLLAKGGITSSDMATAAMEAKSATVLGQAAPGVPLWALGPCSRYEVPPPPFPVPPSVPPALLLSAELPFPARSAGHAVRCVPWQCRHAGGGGRSRRPSGHPGAADHSIHHGSRRGRCAVLCSLPVAMRPSQQLWRMRELPRDPPLYPPTLSLLLMPTVQGAMPWAPSMCTIWWAPPRWWPLRRSAAAPSCCRSTPPRCARLLAAPPWLQVRRLMPAPTSFVATNMSCGPDTNTRAISSMDILAHTSGTYDHVRTLRALFPFRM